MRRAVLGLAGLLAAFTLFGAWLSANGMVPPDATPTPPAHVVSGTFTLVDDATADNGCVGPGDGSWADVRPGAEVTVRDGSGSVLGTGTLGDGAATTWGQFGAKACDYAFSVGVPDSDAYTVAFPGGLSLDYTRAELDADSWRVSPACCQFVPGG